MFYYICRRCSKTQIRMVLVIVCIASLTPEVVSTDIFGDLLKKLDAPSIKSLDERTVVSGLKEAITMGTASAVKLVSRENGYFGKEAIKILLPDKFQMIGEVVRKAGLGNEVNAFILSINRAADNTCIVVRFSLTHKVAHRKLLTCRSDFLSKMWLCLPGGFCA